MPSEATTKLYERLTEDLTRAIKDGVLVAGERMPSIRQTSQARKVSITTVLRAYMQLESRGLIESRPQSGYFVRKPVQQTLPATLSMSQPPDASAEVDVSRVVLATLKTIQRRDAIALGSPFPDQDLFPTRKLYQCLSAVSRRTDLSHIGDGLPPGHPDLIRQIARRHLEAGLTVDPREVVVTAGATEAINLCLQAVARPGDTIAVESPTYYAMLHAIERMGMRAVEVPTHPDEGINLAWLRHTIETHGVTACMVMPNFHNPLGFKMSDARKQELVALAEEYKVPLIENGVYNELYYGDGPVTTLKSFDTRGWVLHCSSFSKSLSSSFRVGWAVAGRYQQAVEKLKFLNTLTTPPLAQLAIARYLENDGFDHHLRALRKTLAQHAAMMGSMVKRFFPDSTRISTPQGGYVLWVELDGQVDTMDLYRKALARGLTVAPGRLFSNSNMYGNFLRLNFSHPCTSECEAAVVALGKMAEAARQKPASPP